MSAAHELVTRVWPAKARFSRPRLPWERAVDGPVTDFPDRPTLSMISLARHGRFGNAVLQYAFLRCFARLHGFRVETPNWIGRELFELRDEAVRGRYPAVVLDAFSEISREGPSRGACHDPAVVRATEVGARYGQSLFTLDAPGLDQARAPGSWPFEHADLEGLFMVNGRHLAPYRDFVLGLFRPIEPISDRGMSAIRTLRESGHTLVGVHVRQGDFRGSNLAQHFELLTPVDSYLHWLSSIWPTLHKPVLIVCTDSPEVVLPAFRGLNPMTSGSMGFDVSDLVPPRAIDWSATGRGYVPDASFFADWWLLTQCDALAISNSTFSYSAALLNQAARVMVRPTFEGPDLEPFDPWRSEPLLFVPRRRTLPGDLARKMSIALEASPRSEWLEVAMSHFQLYPRALERRRRAARRAGGRLGLILELFDPRHYLAAERRFDLPSAAPARASRARG